MSVENWESLSEPVVWRPSKAYLDKSRLLRFMRRHNIAAYADLLARADADPAWFWDAVSADLGLVWQRPYTQVMDTSRGIPWTTWFTGGHFNYVYSALDKHVTSGAGERAAVIWEGEDGETRRLSYRELTALTNRAANALKALGVGKGDRVAIYMPMIPETVAATLACGKHRRDLHARSSPATASRPSPPAYTTLAPSCSSPPTASIAAAKSCRMKDVADAAAAESPSVEKRAGRAARSARDVAWIPARDVWWHEAVAAQPRRTARPNRPPPKTRTCSSTPPAPPARPKAPSTSTAASRSKARRTWRTVFDVQADDTLLLAHRHRLDDGPVGHQRQR